MWLEWSCMLNSTRELSKNSYPSLSTCFLRVPRIRRISSKKSLSISPTVSQDVLYLTNGANNAWTTLCLTPEIWNWIMCVSHVTLTAPAPFRWCFFFPWSWRSVFLRPFGRVKTCLFPSQCFPPSDTLLGCFFFSALVGDHDCNQKVNLSWATVGPVWIAFLAFSVLHFFFHCFRLLYPVLCTRFEILFLVFWFEYTDRLTPGGSYYFFCGIVVVIGVGQLTLTRLNWRKKPYFDAQQVCGSFFTLTTFFYRFNCGINLELKTNERQCLRYRVRFFASLVVEYVWKGGSSHRL